MYDSEDLLPSEAKAITRQYGLFQAQRVFDLVAENPRKRLPLLRRIMEGDSLVVGVDELLRRLEA